MRPSEDLPEYTRYADHRAARSNSLEAVQACMTSIVYDERATFEFNFETQITFQRRRRIQPMGHKADPTRDLFCEFVF